MKFEDGNAGSDGPLATRTSRRRWSSQPHAARKAAPATDGTRPDGHQPHRRHRRADLGQDHLRLQGAETRRSKRRSATAFDYARDTDGQRRSDHGQGEGKYDSGGTTSSVASTTKDKDGDYRPTITPRANTSIEQKPMMTAMSAASRGQRFAAADPRAAGRRRRGQLQERLSAARQDGDAGHDRGDPGQLDAGRSQRRAVGRRIRQRPTGTGATARRRQPTELMPHGTACPIDAAGRLDDAADARRRAARRCASCCSAIPSFGDCRRRTQRARRQHGQGAGVHRRPQRRRRARDQPLRRRDRPSREPRRRRKPTDPVEATKRNLSALAGMAGKDFKAGAVREGVEQFGALVQEGRLPRTSSAG